MAGNWWGRERRGPRPRVHPQLKRNNRKLVKSKVVRHGVDDTLPNEVSLMRWSEAWKRLTLASVAIQRRGFPPKAHQVGGKGK